MSYELVNRVREALHQLSMLNETPVRGEGFEATGPVSGGKPEATMLQPNPTELDHFERRLERWCRDAEKRVREQRKGQADKNGQLPSLSNQQTAYWLLEGFQGVEYRVAAKELGIAPTTVIKLRLAGTLHHAPQTGEYGRPRQRAPRKSSG